MIKKPLHAVIVFLVLWGVALGAYVVIVNYVGGELSHKIVVIDPGHGGKDGGAVGLGGWCEKDSNLAIALRVRRRLTGLGACVFMTRETDTRLSENYNTDSVERANYAKRHSADMLVSIHSNSVSGTICPSGVMTFYHGGDKNAKALAYCIHSELVKAAGLPDQGVRSDLTFRKNGFRLLRVASEVHRIPAVLLEIGCVNHPVDIKKLKNPDFQERVAEAIVRGLKLYAEGNVVEPPKRKDAKDMRLVNIQQAASRESSRSYLGKVHSYSDIHPGYILAIQ